MLSPNFGLFFFVSSLLVPRVPSLHGFPLRALVSFSSQERCFNPSRCRVADVGSDCDIPALGVPGGIAAPLSAGCAGELLIKGLEASFHVHLPRPHLPQRPTHLHGHSMRAALPVDPGPTVPHPVLIPHERLSARFFVFFIWVHGAIAKLTTRNDAASESHANGKSSLSWCLSFLACGFAHQML
jgi:hypothetical protein